MSKRSEATLIMRMKHEDDYGMNGDSSLSQKVRASDKGDNQRTTTLIDNKKRDLRKTKNLQWLMF